MTSETRKRPNDITTGMIIPFILITFALSWGIILTIIFAPQYIPAFLGPMGVTNPICIIAVWAPAVVAMGLIVLQSGFAELRGRHAKTT